MKISHLKTPETPEFVSQGLAGFFTDSIFFDRIDNIFKYDKQDIYIIVFMRCEFYFFIRFLKSQ